MFTVSRWNPSEEFATPPYDMDRVFGSQWREKAPRQTDRNVDAADRGGLTGGRLAGPAGASRHRP